ncbi:MAG: DNA-directed RNA polymerase subunit alpha [Chloroflexi bacterium]|nr:DNA-directed RNA polymerase subunit alpha [Chloroflexota bacterium]
MLDTYLLPPALAEGGPEPVKPEVHVLESEDKYGKVAVEPLRRGFGLTIGNPLRRILLSSTDGSAITWVKIEDVVHEYAAIPGVKEEVMELLLNIKRIRIRAQSERAGKMRLDVSGGGRVCAGDIATSSDFEIVNPELHLATLDSNDAHLSIEFNVEQGVGYQPAIQSDGIDGLPVGVLPLDAIFSPVRKVNYAVERTRVGQVTDYERLVLEVWTDGTITPVEAVRRAAESLVNHFFLFSNLDRVAEAGVDRTPLLVSPEIYQMPIERLELSPRTLNCLKRAHITKVGEVLEMSDDELLKIRNFGEKSLAELRDKLSERGIAQPREELPAATVTEDAPELSGKTLTSFADLSLEDLGDLIVSGDVPVEMAPAADVPVATVPADGEGEDIVDDQEEDDNDDNDIEDIDDEEEDSS